MRVVGKGEISGVLQQLQSCGGFHSWKICCCCGFCCRVGGVVGGAVDMVYEAFRVFGQLGRREREGQNEQIFVARGRRWRCMWGVKRVWKGRGPPFPKSEEDVGERLELVVREAKAGKRRSNSTKKQQEGEGEQGEEIWEQEQGRRDVLEQELWEQEQEQEGEVVLEQEQEQEGEVVWEQEREGEEIWEQEREKGKLWEQKQEREGEEVWEQEREGGKVWEQKQEREGGEDGWEVENGWEGKQQKQKQEEDKEEEEEEEEGDGLLRAGHSRTLPV
ncbi:hypothetical protein VYU27_004840 [Nannochloropsis oceanica]